MLNIMRKHAGSWLIKVLLGAIVVVFIFWGVGSFRSRKASRVAMVDDEIISVEEYQRFYNNLIEQYRQRFGASLNDQLIEMLQLKKQALDQLVSQRLMLKEAEKLGFRVADEELIDEITRTPAFQSNGTFDSRRYRSLLSQIHMSSEEFEQAQKRQMVMDKLRDFIVDGVKVSDDEAWQWYAHENETIDLQYVLFSADRYKEITADAAEVAAYFEKNKDRYKTEPQIRVQYLYFDPETFKGQVGVSQDEVREYYEGHPEEFETEKTVEARHILFKVQEGADEAIDRKQKEKAIEILKMAREGKDFAKLAQTYSEDPAKDKGGYLGTFKRSAMVKPFADQAFSMKAGDISEPVRTRFGWHIIKVEKVNEAHTESLEAATPKIMNQLFSARAKSLAYDRAEEVFDSGFDAENLSKVAESQKLNLIVTEFFTAQGPKTGIVNRSEFASAAFALQPMEISEVQDLGDGYYILQMIEKKDSEIPELATVSDRVKADVIAQKQSEKAQLDAKALLSALKDGQTLEVAAKTYGMSPKQTGYFKRNDQIPEIGQEEAVSAAGFGLTLKKALPEDVIQGSKGTYVIRLADRKAPDAAGFESQKENLRRKLEDQKKMQTFETWLAALKERSQITYEEKNLQ
jgi:peptidyl-prolyl cis-trans isomerase D